MSARVSAPARELHAGALIVIGGRKYRVRDMHRTVAGTLQLAFAHAPKRAPTHIVRLRGCTCDAYAGVFRPSRILSFATVQP